MAPNATEEETKTEEELDTSVDDLRQAKEDADKPQEQAPSEEEPTKGEQSPAEDEAKAKPEATLTTETSETEHDLDWYKTAYDNSTTEALRLKKENDEFKANQTPPPTVEPAGEELTPDQLYIRQKRDEEISTAFSKIQKNYPQVQDKPEYDKFKVMAATVGKNIVDAEKRLPSPTEVYDKTVILLGWTKDDSKEQLGAALKDGAASPRTSSGAPTPSSTSKVTDAMIVANRKMYPDKSDAEIREELEPHIQ